MAKSFTAGQLKELLVIIEDIVIKVFWNRIQNLESKIANMQEGNKHQKGEVNALQWSTKFQNETYEKMKKDMTEEKKELETDYRNNKDSRNKEIHRRNNLRFMGIKEKYRAENETWEESETKLKIFSASKTGFRD